VRGTIIEDMKAPLASILAIWCSCQLLSAVMFHSTGSTTHNTTTPGTVDGLSADAIWDNQGSFGSFLGTPIASNFFITSKHIGAAGTAITFAGGANVGTYNTIASFDSPTLDLTIWQISGTFLSFVPLYTSSDEVGKNLLVIGRGTQRGADYIGPDSVLRGWNWGAGDGVKRWGQNTVSATNSSVIAADFSTTGPNEAMLSVGDSGGAVFIQDAGVWKLAGINQAVSGAFYSNTNTSGSGTQSAIFNEQNLFSSADNVTFAGPLATGSGLFVAARISSDQAWIASVIPEPAVIWLILAAWVIVAVGRVAKRSA